MLKRLKSFRYLLVILPVFFGLFITAHASKKTGQNPIIIIPGLTGSELVNKRTGELVWYRVSRSKVDDIRLPLSTDLASSRDDLVPRDILRSVKIISFLPEVEIYDKLISALEKNGYHEAKWETAGQDDKTNSIFVFAYDWRRDNTETARLLIRKIESLKKRLQDPHLRFDVIAHSMGGLIVRYAALYGDADLPAGKPKPTWAGAENFDKIFLLGTPNQGSLEAFDSLLNGVSYIGSGLNLPWVQNLSRFDIFSIPSIFQLLPQEDSFTAYDEELNPLKIDLFNPMAWEEYDWAIWQDPSFEKNFTAAERRIARAYFNIALARARKFQDAINAETRRPQQPRFFVIGSDCKDTQVAVLLRRDQKKDRWITQFKTDGFTNSSGQKISSEQLKKILFGPGDGTVPLRSLLTRDFGPRGSLTFEEEFLQCEEHSKLATNAAVQKKLFEILEVGQSSSR
ncbi:MAG TPA: hypothetical protein VNK26_07520 [Pyrinomonadaceae bacterium]|nr:hypothetical protein [Pyrinomonadaceae bacterium]